jgi:hypothetical protein
LAVGSLNGAAAGTTAYNCHLRFTPGTVSPNWDIVSYSGQASGGGGGGPEPVIAWSLEGNPTASSTTPTAFTIGSLTAKTTPASTDQLLLQDNAASGALKSVPWSSLPSGGGGGMSIGAPVVGGTSGAVLFIDGSGNLGQNINTFQYYDSPYFSIRLGDNTPGTGTQFSSLDLANTLDNTFVGRAVASPSTTGAYNTGMGVAALQAVTTGHMNTAIGWGAMNTVTVGNNNSCIGQYSLNQVTGDFNCGIGFHAGYNLSSGSNNTFLGSWPGVSTMNNCIALSDGAGNLELDYNHTSAGTWAFTGTTGLPVKTTPVLADHIVMQDSAASNGLKAVPWSSLMSIGGPVTGGTAGSVLFINPAATLAQDNAKFFWNDAAGNLSIPALSFSIDPAVISGTAAPILSADTVSQNIFIGGAGNTTASGAGANQNVGIGANSLHSLVSGVDNFALGASACAAVTTGAHNMGVGGYSLNAITTGSSCVAIGHRSLINYNGTGGCIAIGESSLQSQTGGGSCISIGSYAGGSWAGTNSGNILIGDTAAYNITGGSSNTLIGGWPGPAAAVWNMIGFSYGSNLTLEWNYLTWQTWSMYNSTTAQALHIYNTYDGAVPTTNYERGILDWHVTSNVFTIGTQAGGTGTVRLIAHGAFSKAGAPAAGDLPAGTCAFIDDTTNNQTWLVFNKAGTIRKVQLT